MKVILIYPEFPDTFWSFKHALKLAHKRASSSPLGLMTVSAMLPTEWEKRLIDLNVTSLSSQDLSWADIAFVSAMLVQRTGLQVKGDSLSASTAIRPPSSRNRLSSFSKAGLSRRWSGC